MRSDIRSRTADRSEHFDGCFQTIRPLAIACIAIGALLLTGCASIVNGHNQSVSVKTTNKGADVSAAKCSLSNDKGVWYVSTPGSVTVHRSYGELALTCTMAGLPDGLATVKSSSMQPVDRGPEHQVPATAGLNLLGLAPATFLISRRSAVAS